MRFRRDQLMWAGAGGVTLALAGAGAQRAHMRRIAADPENAVLRDTPIGRAMPVRSLDGTQLHVEVFGDEDGQTVVLAHGWTETIRYWTYIIRDLCARGFRVVAYDHRGHGDSDPAADADYSIPLFGDDLEAVLASCVPDRERAIVAGHSLGAMAVVAWAERHEARGGIGAAALMNTGVGDLLAEHLLVPVPWLAQTMNSMLPARLTLGSRTAIPRFSTPLGHAAIRYVAFGPAASPAQVAFYERMLITTPPDVRANVGIAISEMDLRAALPRLAIPTLVVAGERDRLTPPSHARRIAEQLPELHQLVVLERTGHMAPLERPHEISQALAELAIVAREQHVTA